MTTSSEHLEKLQEHSDSTYDNANDRLNDIVNGRIACDQVLLSEWLQLVGLAAIEKKAAHLNVDMVYAGGVYSMHHVVKALRILPAKSIMENQH
jgi:hypothetical protein